MDVSKMTLAEREQLAELKLPKWAQSELQRLRKEVEHWKERAWQTTTPGASDTVLETYELGEGRPERGLPSGSTIKFKLGKHEYVAVRVHRREPDPATHFLEISVQGGVASIEPRAANVFWIRAVQS